MRCHILDMKTQRIRELLNLKLTIEDEFSYQISSTLTRAIK